MRITSLIGAAVVFFATAMAIAQSGPTTMPASSVGPWLRRPGVGFITVKNPPAPTTQPIADSDQLWLREIRTQAALVASRANLAEALKNDDLRQSDWFEQIGDAGVALQWLAGNIEAHVIEGTRLIAVTLNGDLKPNDRKMLVERIVDAHVEKQRQLVADKQYQRTMNLRNLQVRYQLKKQEAMREIIEAHGKTLTPAEEKTLEWKKNEDKTYGELLQAVNNQLDQIQQETANDEKTLVKWEARPQ